MRVIRFPIRNKKNRMFLRKEKLLNPDLEWEEIKRTVSRYAGVYGLRISLDKPYKVIVWIENSVSLIDYPLLHLAMYRKKYRKYIIIQEESTK
jgi:hypothetical protein